jgi:predicted transposase YbfD/YdcC
MPDGRLTRRVAGTLSARLPELHLEQVPDPRHQRGRKWSLATMLEATATGIMAGCQSLADVEHLTDEMSLPMRRQLGLARRLPDTTLRDTLVGVDPQELRRPLWRQAQAAQRRKALEPVVLPFGVVAMDGKGTAATTWDDEYAQRQPHSVGLGASGIVRTMTCTLVSSRVKVCLDAIPIPAATNEMGHFATAFTSLWAVYGGRELFKLVTYDSGGASKANADLVRQHGLHYLLRLDAQQPTLYREARRLLHQLPVSAAVHFTEDQTGTGTERRYLFVTEELAGYYGWADLKTVVRVHSVKRDRDGKLIPQKAHQQDRYYLCSLARGRLNPEQWLYLIRQHWGVENGTHNLLDKFLEEDKHPFIEADPQGMLNVMLLRRMALNALALFRGVTQRDEVRRLTPWRDVIRWVYNTLIAATDRHLEGLRSREALTPVG